MKNARKSHGIARLAAALSLCATTLMPFAVPIARADVVTDWNIKACDIVIAAKVSPAVAYRVMAIVQSSVYGAVNAITNRYSTESAMRGAAAGVVGDQGSPGAPGGSGVPRGLGVPGGPGASIEAAVAAVNRATLLHLVATQEDAIERAYHDGLSAVPDGPEKSAGIALGEKTAAAMLATRAGDGADAPESYRPHTTAGAYVPTSLPAVPQWPERKPWIMASADQFRPGPPPSLTSDVWARDYNEIKALGAKSSTTRSKEQTDIARFWEDVVSLIYFPVVRSVAEAPGREVTRNARLLAAAAQTIDDALIAIFDAKYHYGFWRPITAIRNGDQDGNDATERDASWVPFIDTPPHPEYPCAHCIVAASVAAVLRAEIGTDAMPALSTSSVTAGGAVRKWTNLDDFMREVAEARICDGVHFRHSTEVGTAMGTQIGELAAAKLLR